MVETSKSKQLNRKKYHSSTSSTSSSSSLSDDEPVKQKKISNNSVISDTKHEAALLMAQRIQTEVTHEDPSNISLAWDILKSIDDDSNVEEHRPKILIT